MTSRHISKRISELLLLIYKSAANAPTKSCIADVMQIFFTGFSKRDSKTSTGTGPSRLWMNQLSKNPPVDCKQNHEIKKI